MLKGLFVRWIFILMIILFLLVNLVAFFHAYKFTHFTSAEAVRTVSPENISNVEKLQVILTGVNNPKPLAKKEPSQDYEQVNIQSNVRLEGWEMEADSAKGTVILFHGYGGEKSSMLDKADVFLELGLNVLLIDFMGSGNSEGNQTTIGFQEAENVKSCYDYLVQRGEKNIYLFGTSMGAVAIMKAIQDYQLAPKAIVLECPFGSLYQTTCARFRIMRVPAFPMAGLLVFWGGIQNGYWGFSHNPAEYAKSVTGPALILYGEKDEKVSRGEINEIFTNLPGPK